MLFNSVEFVIFFLIVFFVYWFVLKNNFKHQNYFLLIASCVFYMAFIPYYILILAVTIIIDYTAAIYIEKATGQKRKLLLIISIVSTCLVLFVFKYFNFFNSNFRFIAGIFHLNYPVGLINIILPIGLSFHTFQSLSYVIEVYNGKQKVEHNFFVYGLYVMFFPQLVAGPIERAGNLLPQFNRPRKFDYSFASSGAKMILLGFFKKVAIADNVAPFVNSIYNSPNDYVGFPMVVATFLFAFQIYCDFSGYSDIAIGTARLLGFNFMINFNRPYISRSVTEFWRRWHISLSTWFRDYLFIPMGGSLVSAKRIYLNLAIVFVVSGLWHGANWTFIIWGALHALYVIVEKIFSFSTGIKPMVEPNKISSFSMVEKLLKQVITFSLVCFAWIFFRANNVSDAFYIIRNMFSDLSDYTSFTKMYLKFRGMGLSVSDLIIPLIFILLLLVIENLQSINKLEKEFLKRPVLKWAFYYFILLVIVFWGYQNDTQNFIYFQF